MKKELMAKKMKYDAKKGGTEWRAAIRKGKQSLNVPKSDKGQDKDNHICEGKDENNKG